jgi:hypothetical protein
MKSLQMLKEAVGSYVENGKFFAAGSVETLWRFARFRYRYINPWGQYLIQAGHRNELTVFCVAVFIDLYKSIILSGLRER